MFETRKGEYRPIIQDFMIQVDCLILSSVVKICFHCDLIAERLISEMNFPRDFPLVINSYD